MPRLDATRQQRREGGRIQAVDERQIGIDSGRVQRIPERFGRLKRSDDPLNSHGIDSRLGV